MRGRHGRRRPVQRAVSAGRAASTTSRRSRSPGSRSTTRTPSPPAAAATRSRWPRARRPSAAAAAAAPAALTELRRRSSDEASLRGGSARPIVSRQAAALAERRDARSSGTARGRDRVTDGCGEIRSSTRRRAPATAIRCPCRRAGRSSSRAPPTVRQRRRRETQLAAEAELAAVDAKWWRARVGARSTSSQPARAAARRSASVASGASTASDHARRRCRAVRDRRGRSRRRTSRSRWSGSHGPSLGATHPCDDR